jgi:hypothetical protein
MRQASNTELVSPLGFKKSGSTTSLFTDSEEPTGQRRVWLEILKDHSIMTWDFGEC